VLIAAALLCLVSCGRSELFRPQGGGGAADGGSDSDSDSDADADAPEYDAHGIDMLFMVDNSMSMDEEQKILADMVFDLVGGLMVDIDSVRVAVVSSDLGLMWGGNPYEDGDGWPGSLPTNCGADGDEGDFQHTTPMTITIDDETQACPDVEGSWVESPEGDLPNAFLPLEAACITALGDHGCGWEQSLESASMALARPDQADFMRDEHLLLVVFVSDEDDCSVESNDLYSVTEIQVQTQVNLACGLYPEFLYDPSDYADTFVDLKGGNPNAVLYTAIIGVPLSSACQGRGDQIGDCLNQEEMQPVGVEEDAGWVFAPACERYEGDELVTKARPARRFVELAQTFGGNAYVHSICNEDWSDALDAMIEMIDQELGD
jgi:hypothetical protein